VAHHSIPLTLGAGLVAASLAIACGEGRQAPATRGEEPPSVQTDPVAERGFIRLTGCVKPDATPGRFVLASVATAGVLNTEEQRDQERSWTAEDDTPTEAQGTTMATSTYQLIPSDDEDLAEYENQRVTVRGRIAAETPTGTTGGAGSQGGAGSDVQTDAAGAKVTADAPPLRGLHVESIDKVADTCEQDRRQQP
jgi:hypothetical protein